MTKCFSRKTQKHESEIKSPSSVFAAQSFNIKMSLSLFSQIAGETHNYCHVEKKESVELRSWEAEFNELKRDKKNYRHERERESNACVGISVDCVITRPSDWQKSYFARW